MKDLKEILIFKPKKDRLHKEKPKLVIEDVLSGLPTSRNYGLSTTEYFSKYMPEKFKIKNLSFLFKKTTIDNSINRILSLFIKNNKFSYTPEDIILEFSLNPKVIFNLYSFILKKLEKEFGYKKDFDNHKKVLAFILSRFESESFDVLAIPMDDTFFSKNKLGFGRTAYKDVINFLVYYDFFYKTYGHGNKTKELKNKIFSFRNANYIPSVLIPTDLLKNKYFYFANKFVKSISFVENLGSSKLQIKIPVEPISEKEFLSKEVFDKLNKQAIFGKRKLNVIRRTFDEFYNVYSLLGLYFKDSVTEQTIINNLYFIYNKIISFSKNSYFNYSKIVHAITYCFKSWNLRINYKKNSFKNIVQYILYGRTNNKLLNNELKLPSDWKTDFFYNLKIKNL